MAESATGSDQGDTLVPGQTQSEGTELRTEVSPTTVESEIGPERATELDYIVDYRHFSWCQ